MPLSRKRKLKRSKNQELPVVFDESIHSIAKYPTKGKGRFGVRLNRNGAPSKFYNVQEDVKVGRLKQSA